MASFPPSGFDRATGTNGQPGTPTPEGAVTYQPSPTFLEELPESPKVEWGEHITFVHTFKCDQDTALNIQLTNYRGVQLEDSGGFTSTVLTCLVLEQKGDYCIVEITSEGTFYPPPDEYSLEFCEFNPSIFLHPSYAAIANYTPELGTNEGNNIGPQLIGAITQAANSPNFAQSQDQSGVIGGLLNGTGTDVNTGTTEEQALDMANALVAKLQRGESTFYLAGMRVTWAEYFFQSTEDDGLPGFNPGGYIEDPVYQGGLPPYFWSSNGTSAGQNTLISLASQINPTIYPPVDAGKNQYTISWLRQADHIQFERVWFKYTHSWIGGPIGNWDSDLYPTSTAPFQLT